MRCAEGRGPPYLLAPWPQQHTPSAARLPRPSLRAAPPASTLTANAPTALVRGRAAPIALALPCCWYLHRTPSSHATHPLSVLPLRSALPAVQLS